MIMIRLLLTGISALFLQLNFAQAQSDNKIVHKVEFNYMEGCETGKGDCKPVILIRQSLQDSIKVVFPIGGTASSVQIYPDTSFIRWIRGKPTAQPTPLRNDNKRFGEGNPVLDLTGLPDGKYRPHMLSCNVGGTFELIIKTEPKKE